VEGHPGTSRSQKSLLVQSFHLSTLASAEVPASQKSEVVKPESWPGISVEKRQLVTMAPSGKTSVRVVVCWAGDSDQTYLY
jgi:hypothetical protein